MDLPVFIPSVLIFVFCSQCSKFVNPLVEQFKKKRKASVLPMGSLHFGSQEAFSSSEKKSITLPSQIWSSWSAEVHGVAYSSLMYADQKAAIAAGALHMVNWWMWPLNTCLWGIAPDRRRVKHILLLINPGVEILHYYIESLSWSRTWCPLKNGW